MSTWIGVDLDGTLAYYEGFKGADIIGAPVPLMLTRVYEWLAAGVEVRIVTARVAMENNPWPEQVPAARAAIEAWCLRHVGQVLPITASKDYAMIELWDDRAVRVEKNTGRRIV